jgi:Tat protein translocase TatB subunit
MDFFGIGPLELLVIVVVALLVLGPEKLTDTTRSVGRMWRDVQRGWRDVSQDMTKDMTSADEELPTPSYRYARPAQPPAQPTQVETPESKEVEPSKDKGPQE